MFDLGQLTLSNKQKRVFLTNCIFNLSPNFWSQIRTSSLAHCRAVIWVGRLKPNQKGHLFEAWPHKSLHQSLVLREHILQIDRCHFWNLKYFEDLKYHYLFQLFSVWRTNPFWDKVPKNHFVWFPKHSCSGQVPCLTWVGEPD